MSAFDKFISLTLKKFDRKTLLNIVIEKHKFLKKKWFLQKFVRTMLKSLSSKKLFTMIYKKKHRSCMKSVSELDSTIKLVFNFWVVLLKKLFKSKNKMRINVLVRTSNRPKYFQSCYESIINQTYKNICIIVSYDNKETREYLKNYRKIKTISVSIPDFKNYPAPSIQRGKRIVKFPPNFYMNQLMKHAKRGFIIFLDDDDMLIHPTSLQTIADHITGKNDLIFWRVQFPDDHLIPESEYFKKPPEFWHVSGIGLSFHSKYKAQAQWDGWKGGDYAVAKKLYACISNKIYIDQVLTGLQRKEVWGGFGKRDDKMD